MNDNSHDPGFMTVSLAVATIPHIPRLSWWIIIWCVFFWIYSFSGSDFFKSSSENSRPSTSVKNPSWIKKWVLVFLAIAGIAGIAAEYRTVFGQDAGVGLISIMASLKLLEIKNRRDLIITVFIIYFVIITNLFFSTSVFMTVYMFIAVLITTAALVFYTQSGTGLKSSFRISASVLLRALPLMIIMFVLFPRIQGSLWKGFRVNSGKAGFSDTLSPGSVSSLAMTGDVAFRVEFSGEIPPVNELYWKGVVFGSYDGRNWKKSMSYGLPQYFSRKSPDHEYTVTLEPSNSRYMFISGCPVSIPPGSEIMADGSLRSRFLITERMQYRVASENSCDRFRMTSPDEEFISLPYRGNERSRSQALLWKNRLVSHDAIVRAALDFLRTGGFTYSLKPPLLDSGDPVDEFLFSAKKGYCEHYATAFAFLMRSAGIPARVVGGYQGGEINPVGGHLIVTQDKAHAWVEIFHEKNGWITVDPTSVVAPERLTRGLSSSVPKDEISLAMSMSENRFVGGLWKKTLFALDYANHGWNRLVIGYTYNRQKKLFDFIGINPGKVTGALFLVSVMLVSVMTVFIVVWKLRIDPLKKTDPVAWNWMKFCKKMSDAGIKRSYSEGPVEFMERIVSLRPDLKNEAELIAGRYVRLRYSRHGFSVEAVAEFVEMVKKFRAGSK